MSSQETTPTISATPMAAIYQHPTNMLGVEAIADHLELLAKSLPEK
jgi:hypothetical protein